MHLVSEDFDAAFAAFKEQHGLNHVIAFSGGASTTLEGVAQDDPLQAQFAAVQEERERRLVDEALDVLKHYRVAILTGGTIYGFPLTATGVARQKGFKTIGVFPKTAHDKGQVIAELDLALCVHPSICHSAWGDESSVFAKLLDVVIVCGGGAGTLIEVAHLLKMNEGLKKYQKPLKLIVPVHGTGGVADGLPFVWGKQEIKAACMPHHAIPTGNAAGRFIQESVDLHTIL